MFGLTFEYKNLYLVRVPKAFVDNIVKLNGIMIGQKVSSLSSKFINNTKMYWSNITLLLLILSWKKQVIKYKVKIKSKLNYLKTWIVLTKKFEHYISTFFVMIIGFYVYRNVC